MIAFGPIPSRRLGRSLGVNNVPQPKACSYGCVYCQVGPTLDWDLSRREFYRPEILVREVSDRVSELRKRDEAIDHLSFVPDGEPTLELHLGREILGLKPLGIPIAVFTNASLLHLEEVRRELALADLVSVKIDTVDEVAWRRVNRPGRGVTLKRMLEGLRAFSEEFQGRLITETMLLDGINDNEEKLAITAAFVAGLAPKVAYIAVPTRPTMAASARPASEEAVTRAYHIFGKLIPNVECLVGFSDASFGFAGDVERDLLGILAVHPMRRGEVSDFLAKAKASWSVVETLVERGELRPVEHRGELFYSRNFRNG